LLTAALLFCVLRPDLAKEAGEGISLEEAWRGMFASKNMFGQAASIASVLWLHAYLSGQVKFLKFAYGMAVGMTSLVLSHSSTALGSTFFVMALELLLLSRVARNSRAAPYLIGVFVVALLLYSIAALNLVPGLDFLLTPITAVTGKDSSFSGRTIVWSYVRAHIEQHPILGTGYGAYWIGPIVSSPSYVFILAKMPYPPEAHNGYLDIINDLGYVGLACLLGYLWIYLKQCFALLKIDFTQAVLFIALLFQQLVGNLTESMWFASSSLNFAVMTLATFALARTSVEQQIRPVPQAAQRRRAVPGRRNRTSAAAASR
jgi:O-antigen ligase